MITWGLGSTITSRDADPLAVSDTESPLSADTLERIISESERAYAVVEIDNGLSRIDDSEQRHVDVAVVVVVTSEQLYFVSGHADEGSAAEAGSLRYDHLAGVDVDADGLALSTVDGVVWQLPVDDADDTTVATVIDHLVWIGTIRSRVVSRRNDVELAAGEIRDAARDMDWERGVECYETHRSTIDDLLDAVFRTEPVPPNVLAPEVTELERTLVRAYADLLIERADSRLTLGQQLLRTGDHERARTVIEAAHADYETGREHAEALRRGDAFVFGEQRDLRDRLEQLGREIQAVGAEPLRRAQEATLLARSRADPAETVDHWERAFRRFGDVLALQGIAPVAGDVAEIRREIENAAGQLIAIHRALSRNQWEAGIERASADVDAAVAQLEAAISHLQRAQELAEEFRPEAASDLTLRLEKMREGVEELRDTETFTGRTDDATSGVARTLPDDGTRATAGSGPAATDDVGDEPQAPGDASDGEDLTDIDAHHDIQIDAALGETDEDRTRETEPANTDEGDEIEEFVLPDPDEQE